MSPEEIKTRTIDKRLRFFHRRSSEAAQPPSRVGFLDLPPEIRLQIYCDVLSEITPGKVGLGGQKCSATSKTRGVHFVHVQKTDRKGRRNPLTLLRTCRQIYEDVKYNLRCQRLLLDRAYTFELDGTFWSNVRRSDTIEPGFFPTTHHWPADAVRRIKLANPTHALQRFNGKRLGKILRQLAVHEIPRLQKLYLNLERVDLDLNVLNVYNGLLTIDPRWSTQQTSFDLGLLCANELLFNDPLARSDELSSIGSHKKSFGWYYTVSRILQVQLLRPNTIVFERNRLEGTQEHHSPFGKNMCIFDKSRTAELEQANKWFNDNLHRHSGS